MPYLIILVSINSETKFNNNVVLECFIGNIYVITLYECLFIELSKKWVIFKYRNG